MYLNKLNISNDMFKVLTKEEENELFARYKQNNDLEARDRIVFANLKFVYKILSKYNKCKFESISMEDLYQQSIVSILSSIERYDCDADNKFSTYAYAVLYRSLDKYIYKNDKLIKPPIHLEPEFHKIDKAIYELECEYEKKEINSNLLNKKKNISKKMYSNYLKYNINLLSLNEKSNKTIDSIDTEYIDLISSDTSIENECINKDLTKSVMKAFHELDEKEKNLIKHVYFDNNTIVSYSKAINVNEQTVRNRRDKIFKKLKLSL